MRISQIANQTLWIHQWEEWILFNFSTKWSFPMDNCVQWLIFIQSWYKKDFGWFLPILHDILYRRHKSKHDRSFFNQRVILKVVFNIRYYCFKMTISFNKEEQNRKYKHCKGIEIIELYSENIIKYLEIRILINRAKQ